MLLASAKAHGRHGQGCFSFRSWVCFASRFSCLFPVSWPNSFLFFSNRQESVARQQTVRGTEIPMKRQAAAASCRDPIQSATEVDTQPTSTHRPLRTLFFLFCCGRQKPTASGDSHTHTAKHNGYRHGQRQREGDDKPTSNQQPATSNETKPKHTGRGEQQERRGRQHKFLVPARLTSPSQCCQQSPFDRSKVSGCFAITP